MFFLRWDLVDRHPRAAPRSRSHRGGCAKEGAPSRTACPSAQRRTRARARPASRAQRSAGIQERRRAVLQVSGPIDPGIPSHQDLGMKKLSRRKNRKADPAVVALRPCHDQRGKRHLGDVESAKRSCRQKSSDGCTSSVSARSRPASPFRRKSARSLDWKPSRC